ncbi:hypothetical protein RB593_002291 [Gaeumannomyces tritici]
MATPGAQISKRRKFVADGVFYAELNEFFQRELAEEGYSGVEVRVTPTVTDIIIRATHTQEVLGEQGRRIRELTSLIQKRFKFPENSVSLYAAKDFIDSATRHVLLRQGVLGIKVKIMRGSDPEGKAGPQKSLPDAVTILEPKEEQPVVQPISQDYGAKAAQVQLAAEAQRQAEQAAGGEEEEEPTPEQ